ncbi:MFS transporter [Haliangium sp.]|uniref:MFS transporter n=1 Tax=Haliangium sp. TaxID=2663208 RepID=UPI003D0E2E8D
MGNSTTAMPRRLLTVLYLAIFMAALDGSIVGPALNTLRDAFSVSERDLSWAVNMYVLTGLVAMPLTARMSDLYGRRRLFALTVALFGLGSAVVVAAPDFTIILVGRGIQGLGAGGIMPICVAMIGDEVPVERQGTALGFMGMVSGLAFIIGPVVGGVLLQWSWRFLFAINLPIAVALIGWGLRVLPRRDSAGQASLDWQGLLLLGVALGALALGLNRIDVAHWFDSLLEPRVWGALVVPVVALPWFYLVERRAASPAVNLSVLGTRSLVIANLLALGGGLAMVSILFVPAGAKLALHIDDSTASFMLLPAILTFVAVSPLAGSMLGRLGSRTVFQVGGVILTAGMLAFAYGATDTWSFYLATILMGIGLATMSNLPLRYIVNNEVSSADRASAQAVLLVFQTTGQVIGAALIGALAESAGSGADGYLTAFMGLGVAAAVLTAVAFGLTGRRAEAALLAARVG